MSKASIKIPSPAYDPWRLWILVIAALATFAKLWCAATTIGTNDVMLYYKYGAIISDKGLAEMYKTTVLFNHTPLVGYFSSILYNLSLPDGRWFPLFLRLPGIIADLATVGFLMNLRRRMGRPPGWALAVLAASPVSFMVTGYHGNTDSLLALLLILSASAAMHSKPISSGLWLGLACNIKVIPLLLVPILIFYWLQAGWKRTAQSLICMGLVCFLGWLPALISVPDIFFSNVLSYKGYWGIWGTTLWLYLTKIPEFSVVSFTGLSTAQEIFMSVSRAAIILASCILGWKSRKSSGLQVFETIGLLWVLFFALAPGVAPQYFAWILPFLVILSPGWFVLFTAASSLYLFVFYNTISGGMPWNYGIAHSGYPVNWILWGLWPWFVSCAAMISLLKAWAINLARKRDGLIDGAL